MSSANSFDFYGGHFTSSRLFWLQKTFKKLLGKAYVLAFHLDPFRYSIMSFVNEKHKQTRIKLSDRLIFSLLHILYLKKSSCSPL